MSKVLYVVDINGAQEDFTNIKDVAVALGVEKITKKDIKLGKYPMISIQEAVAEDVDMEHKAEFAKLEQEEHERAYLAELEESPITDEPYKLNQHDMAAIEALDERMVNMVDALDHDSVELYDELNRIKLIIESGAGADMSATQFKLLTETMTGSYKAEIVYDDPNEDALPLTNISDGKPALAPRTPVLTNTGSTGRQKLADEDVDYPEVGSFKDEKYLKRFYKQLSDAQLDEWIELEGLTYKHCEHESINRMRKCMAIKELHFPSKPKVNTKSKSKYSQYSTEELVAMANKAGLPVRDSKGSDQILRMYTIMELRKAGLIG